MFTFKPTTKTFELQDVIDKLHNELIVLNSSTEEYAKIADQLVKLYNLKDATVRSQKVSADVLATIAANLGTALLVLNFERAGVVTSKAFSFVGKLK